MLLDGEDLLLKPLLERKARLGEVMKRAPGALQFSNHLIGNGAPFLRQACKVGAEGLSQSAPMHRTDPATVAAPG
jgi:bifunctional non-homologous end joining protein LigD